MDIFVGINRLLSNPDHIQCLKWSLVSRLVLFLIQVISINVIPQHNADAYKPQDFLTNQTAINKLVNHTLIGFARWDSLYFLTIAKDGYVNDQMVAFFPLYPAIIRLVKSVVFPFATSSHDGLLIVVGSAINFILFIASSVILYELTYQMFRSRITSLESVKLYCFNPASIFMSACYSESLFLTLTLSGLLYIEHGKLFLASFMFGLSSLTRSNGLVSLGFIAYYHISSMFLLYQRVHKSSRIIRELLLLFLNSVIVITPFLVFQGYSHLVLCSSLGRNTSHHNQDQEFCQSYLHLPYAYVQKKYWNVGLFSYYQLKQIPNFLLAQPILAISYWTILKYSGILKQLISLITTFKARRRGPSLFSNGHCLPYVIHLIFLTIVSLFFINVQISTRFILSSSPVIYWVISSAPCNKKFYFRMYFLTYFIIGTLLHCSFYPWT